MSSEASRPVSRSVHHHPSQCTEKEGTPPPTEMGSEDGGICLAQATLATGTGQSETGSNQGPMTICNGGSSVPLERSLGSTHQGAGLVDRLALAPDNQWGRKGYNEMAGLSAVVALQTPDEHAPAMLSPVGTTSASGTPSFRL
ncbi:hypothetical protein AB5N19_05332 [Seiridium cardinale]